MQTKTRSKPLIGITALSLLVGLSLASNSEVKNDLSHAVQSIHQVIFTSNTKPENQKTVELKADGSQVQIQGKVLNTSAGMGNSLSQNSQNSQLYYGKKNSIAGSNSAILYGRNNTIKGNQNAIIGGYKNKIWSENTSSHNNVIIGGRGNNINESSSIIIGGSDNTINGSNNLILAGKQKTIKGNNTYVLGSNINNQNQSDNFIWSDNKIREDNKSLQPRSSNSFIIRSANGVAINTFTPLGQGVTVNGMVQLANENLTCDANTLGAMKFEEIRKNGQTEGCFFACEKHGSKIKWFPMAKEACGAKEVAPKNPENPVIPTPTPVVPAPTPINGQCAPAKNTCTVGTVKNQGENNTHFTWQCEGSNGESSASCSLEKPAAPVVPTCSIELRGNHINGDRIEVPANGIEYQIDQYAISRSGTLGELQVELDSTWEKEQTTDQYTQYTNENRLLYFWPDFDQKSSTQDPKIGLYIDSTWEGSYALTIKNIVHGKELCRQTYIITKDVPHPTKYYRYLTAMPNFSMGNTDSYDTKYAFWTEEKNSIPSFPTDADLWHDTTPFGLLKNKLWKTWEEPEQGDSILSMYFEAPQYRSCWFKNYYLTPYPHPECPIQQTFNPAHIYGSCQKGQAAVEIPIKKYQIDRTPEGNWINNGSYEIWTIIFECKEHKN